MGKTTIEWTASILPDGTAVPGYTFNPWRGCTKVAEGCKHCYAETLAKRNPKTLGVWGPQGTRVVASDAMWGEPKKWNKAAAKDGARRRVFCASLADVFEHRPDLLEPRKRLFGLVDATPSLDWLLLTKRPQNIWDMWGPEEKMDAITGLEESLAPHQLYRRNVWLGCSIATQADADRDLPLLAQCRELTPVLYVSVEPLLEEIDLRPHLEWLDWVIVGGESGSGARRCHTGWVRQIVQHCLQAGVPRFVKQIGANVWMPDFNLRDRKGGNPAEWPDDLRVREFPGGTAIERKPPADSG